MPPYHGTGLRADEAGILQHFARIAEAAPIPIMVQDAPLSGVNLSVAFLVRLAREIPTVRYFKIEMPGTAAKLRALIEAGGDAIVGPFDGEESITLMADLDAGATGTMPSALLPDLIKPVLAHRSGRRNDAAAAYARILPLINYENRQCGLRATKAVIPPAASSDTRCHRWNHCTPTRGLLSLPASSVRSQCTGRNSRLALLRALSPTRFLASTNPRLRGARRRIASAEGAVRSAGGNVPPDEYTPAHALGHVRIEGISGLDKRVVAIRVEHFGPHVDVVASRVAGAREQMAEMRQPMAQHNLARHSDALKLRALERGNVDGLGIGQRVQRHVNERACGVLDGFKALVEAPRLAQPLDHRVGNGLASYVMPRVALQHLGLEGPVLEELRWQLDEIAQHIRRQAPIGHPR